MVFSMWDVTFIQGGDATGADEAELVVKPVRSLVSPLIRLSKHGCFILFKPGACQRR